MPRWARAESLHVTLKFIGEQPDAELPRLQDALATIQAKPVSLAVRGTAFSLRRALRECFGWALMRVRNCRSAAQVDMTLAVLKIPAKNTRLRPT